ncbi:unnamed protein product [Microthlaspi erraticum]|uniref:Uncharacterized protein n=1 Tax=Microthlaspi erraticum TaxID=1685480 RepID=A0A6D2IUW3_9BRAS|nr:unnamed protein product [Microthlaspi erraticum]
MGNRSSEYTALENAQRFNELAKEALENQKLAKEAPNATIQPEDETSVNALKINALRQEIHKLIQENDEMKKTNESLETKLDELQQEKDGINGELLQAQNNLAATVKDSWRRVSNLSIKNESLTLERDKLTQERISWNEEKSELRKVNDEVQNLSEMLKRELMELRQQKDSINRELLHAQTQIEDSWRRASNLSIKNESLTLERDKLTNERISWNEEKSELRKVNGEIKKTNESLETKLAVLQQENDVINSELLHAEKTIAYAEKTVAAQIEDSSNLSKKNESLTVEIQSLTDKLTNESAEVIIPNSPLEKIVNLFPCQWMKNIVAPKGHIGGDELGSFMGALVSTTALIVTYSNKDKATAGLAFFSLLGTMIGKSFNNVVSYMSMEKDARILSCLSKAPNSLPWILIGGGIPILAGGFIPDWNIRLIITSLISMAMKVGTSCMWSISYGIKADKVSLIVALRVIGIIIAAGIPALSSIGQKSHVPTGQALINDS